MPVVPKAPFALGPRTGYRAQQDIKPFHISRGCIIMRPSERSPDSMRAVSIECGVAKHAEGSCIIRFGDTHVLCTASLEERLPPWLRGQGRGWVTAEYGMLPRATHDRSQREAARGRRLVRGWPPMRPRL